MDRDCEDCNHKPVCRLWYSEVESRFGGIEPSYELRHHLDILNTINIELAEKCKFWKEKD